jgi:hypothetical protein
MQPEPEVQGALIFIAKRLADAQRLEGILSQSGIEYTVEPDEYQAGIVFRTARVGAFFYVDPADKEKAAAVMLEHGYVPAA